MKLVLLPGMDGTGSLFEPFIESLGTDIDPIVVVYPNDDPLTYTELGEVARAKLPKDEPYILLGESFSGPIALSLAATNPQGLSALVLCCSFAKNPRPSLTTFQSLWSVIPIHLIPIAALSFFLLGSVRDSMHRANLSAALRKVATDVLNARMKAILTVDVTGLLDRITVPTLYLRALSDRVVPDSAAEVIKECVPSLSIVNIESPHFLLQVAPEEAASSLTQFIMEQLDAL